MADDTRRARLRLLDERLTLNVPEAARLAGVSTGSLYRWIRDGDFPAVRIGPRTVRVRTSDLLTMLEGEQ